MTVNQRQSERTTLESLLLQTVPALPVSHQFIESLIRTIRRE
jgi:hypothetical protein